MLVPPKSVAQLYPATAKKGVILARAQWPSVDTTCISTCTMVLCWYNLYQHVHSGLMRMQLLSARAQWSYVDATCISTCTVTLCWYRLRLYHHLLKTSACWKHALYNIRYSSESSGNEFYTVMSIRYRSYIHYTIYNIYCIIYNV